MTTLAFAGHTISGRARTSARISVAVVQLHDELWRITRPDGEVLGYIEQFSSEFGDRYRAKRFIVRQRRFIAMGEFWSMDDAIALF